MIDRRAFLGIIPTAALTSKVMAADLTKISTSEGPVYKGYRIWEWTGWKPAKDTSTYVGQWLAAPLDRAGKYIPMADVTKERPLLCASVPGYASAYVMGDYFDVSVHRGQIQIEARTPERVKERERRRGLRRMFRLIDRYSQ